MSEQANEDILALNPPVEVDTSFAAVVAALAPNEFGEASGEGSDQDAAPAAAAGQQAAGGEGAGAQAGADRLDAGGAGGEQGVPGDGAAGADLGTGTDAGPGSAAGAVEFSAIAPKFGEISTAIETNSLRIHQASALEEVREEMPKYFEYVQRHPRTLVGEQVPSMTGDGMEVLRDSADAKDWQDAVKEQLALEVRDRAQRRLEDDRGTLDMIHGSIELFQNNPDLVPGTRQFDAQLAADFVRVAKPYEVRTDGKLQGYSIPVQGLVDQLRRQVAAARTESAKAAQAQEAAKAAGTGQAGPGRPRTANPAPKPATTDETPQAGIPGKAGSSSEAENFDTLFGTLGMPHAPRF